MKYKNVVIVGASGGIGKALTQQLSAHAEQIFLLSRSTINPKEAHHKYLPCDFRSEQTVADAAQKVASVGAFDLVIVATGLLHTDDYKPEKRYKDINTEQFLDQMQINALGPSLVAKHFVPLLSKEYKSVFAVLSAKVGSIEDNQLGGWYSYRASKAALNMMVKTLSIEVARTNKHAVMAALHPGTVDTGLSAPFQSNVPTSKLFSPETAARYILSTIDKIKPEDTGKLWSWDGTLIPY